VHSGPAYGSHALFDSMMSLPQKRPVGSLGGGAGTIDDQFIRGA